MSHYVIMYYVRIYRKALNTETWQTLGPYDHDIASKLMDKYLKKGICCWIEDVKISE